jgi:hypothetical protein
MCSVIARIAIGRLLYRGEYILQPAEYSAFWTTVKKERIECARYLARIIKLLVEYEKDPHKVEKTFKKTMVGNTQEFITILLHTIQYLDMFGRYSVWDSPS